MKSKEDLIRERYPFYNEDIANKDVELCGEQVKILMDSYAKQEAEAYEKWLWNSRYTRKSAPFADLWELYLESKKQKV